MKCSVKSRCLSTMQIACLAGSKMEGAAGEVPREKKQ
jgi:hypothetical protein